MDRLAFCFGVHNHQPIGNFDHVMVEATERAYRPFLERLEQRPEVRLSVHCTGSLLEWLRERAPGTFDLLGTVAADSTSRSWPCSPTTTRSARSSG